MKYYVKSPGAKKRPYWTGKGWTAYPEGARVFDSVEDAREHMARVAGGFQFWTVQPIEEKPCDT